MTNLVNFPSQRDPGEEAATWLIRMQGGLSAEEAARFEVWLQDPLNRAAFQDCERLWKQMDSLTLLADMFPLRDAAKTERAERPRFPRAALATAFCCAIVGVLALFAFRGSGRLPLVTPPGGEIYSTAVGESQLVSLPDGSIITLNTDSRVEVRYAPAERDISLLRGEANFKVAKDPARPFNVRVGTRILQAVGTAFNVRLRAESDFEVTVTEGKVKVLVEDTPARTGTAVKGNPAPQHTKVESMITAQEIATVNASSDEVRHLQPNEIDERLAWQRGMLIFSGEPLGQVLDEVSRYTSTQFVLADDSLSSVRVGGYFPVGEVDNLLVALRDNFQINSRRDEDNRIVLSRAEY